eukprot:COSAG02_NODE_15252_length_1189_cov_2.834627_2_plen_104_part_01
MDAALVTALSCRLCGMSSAVRPYPPISPILSLSLSLYLSITLFSVYLSVVVFLSGTTTHTHAHTSTVKALELPDTCVYASAAETPAEMAEDLQGNKMINSSNPR